MVRVPPRDVLNLMHSMKIHSNNEVIIACKRSTRPDFVFANTHRRDDESIQNTLLEQKIDTESFQKARLKIYTMINSPSEHQSLSLIKYSKLAIKAYDFCVHQNNSLIRNLLIGRTIKTNQCIIAFSMLQDKTLQDETRFMSEVNPEFVHRIFWQCQFKEELRDILLQRCTSPIRMLTLLDDVTPEEINAMAVRR